MARLARCRQFGAKSRLMGNPLNTKFRQPFTVLVEKDYMEVAQVQELKDFSRYFRLLVTADSLLSLTNPGYPWRSLKKIRV